MTTYESLPYFMTDPEWYEVNEDGYDPETDTDRGYILTDKAPQEAIDSYTEFYAVLEGQTEAIYK